MAVSAAHITCSLPSSNCWSFARVDRSLSSIKSSILSYHTAAVAIKGNFVIFEKLSLNLRIFKQLLSYSETTRIGLPRCAETVYLRRDYNLTWSLVEMFSVQIK